MACWCSLLLCLSASHTIRYTAGTLQISMLILTGVIFVLHCIGFAWIFLHYGTDMTYAFDQCVDDLMRIASAWKMAYNMVNILIFVLGWLLVFGGNLYWAKVLKDSAS